MSEKRDCYEILGVARSANADEVKSAYRKAALKWHPDRNPGDADAVERFKELTLAYQTLIRPRSRDAYDRRHHPVPDPSPGSGGPAPQE